MVEYYYVRSNWLRVSSGLDNPVKSSIESCSAISNDIIRLYWYHQHEVIPHKYRKGMATMVGSFMLSHSCVIYWQIIAQHVQELFFNKPDHYFSVTLVCHGRNVHLNGKVVRMTALWSPLETLKASFNVPSDDQSSYPDDLSVSVWPTERGRCNDILKLNCSVVDRTMCVSYQDT